MAKGVYSMPELGYGFKDLEPFISEAQLRIHFEKHHSAYVKAANDLLARMDAARAQGTELDLKAALKALSFNVGGHRLHSLYWKSMAPPGKGGGEPAGELGEAIAKEFGGFARFKSEFSQAALSVEGSGWAALCYCRETERPLIMQVEKHNANVYPAYKLLLCLDVFEHAYYLDYKNERAKFVEAFWSIVDWEAAGKRFEEAVKR